MFFKKLPMGRVEKIGVIHDNFVPAYTNLDHKPKPSLSRKPGAFPRLLKISVSLGMLGIGLFAILAENGHVTSDNAVVSTQLVWLRAPIDGVVSGLKVRVGSPLTQGQLIGSINNPLIDQTRLMQFRETLQRALAQQQAAVLNRSELIALQASLKQRAAIHTKANTERLNGLVAEAGKTLAALASKERQAQLDVDRQRSLSTSGFVSKADFQRLETAYDSAQQEVAAQQGRLASLRAETGAAADGVLSDPGGIDVSYSAQRADQVAIDISNLTRIISDYAADVDVTRVSLQAEAERVRMLGVADFNSPVEGMIWKLEAANGERLSTGETAAEIVDCSAAVLLAAIPQDRVSYIEIGGQAQYRLSGESIERQGIILSVAGQGNLANNSHYASVPFEESAAAFVRVTMSGSENVEGKCLIGRTARVLLQASGGGILARIYRHIF